jgi:hypothetical protein
MQSKAEISDYLWMVIEEVFTKTQSDEYSRVVSHQDQKTKLSMFHREHTPFPKGEGAH